MTKTISKEDILLEKLRTLTTPQQEEVLDFIEFLQSKNEKKLEAKTEEKPKMSAHEAAKQWAGCVESGVGDLSYNKKYLDGPFE
ncbi:MAG: DUF2281 domain-containing protein [Okeania sp. SIO2H7]|nr:DUF2281 domain-containing protein [Okeania sp. SIO2H7]